MSITYSPKFVWKGYRPKLDAIVSVAMITSTKEATALAVTIFTADTINKDTGQPNDICLAELMISLASDKLVELVDNGTFIDIIEERYLQQEAGDAVKAICLH